ncbi:T9SS type A sorting domain-containing protein [Aliifodinibius salicampi]|uniref:T9SS type A sorting domain-containing protein n=1 Tax=Fodinibius salicampi TaxID=1920655 RepID=A0ABT3Q2W1_9BACT|nr:T9SS type A sorting domain-containing protein [Fodinibius salicampi]MCW9714448.1 T9SS type A sorting domain-containing protein [Fodinibius salicampi]
MRQHIYQLFIISLIAFLNPIVLQAQHAQIERDYQKGQLSLDKKVLYQFYAIRQPDQLPKNYEKESSEPIKCGTPAHMDLHKNRSQLSAGTIARIESMTSQPSQHSTKTYTSASGRFQINYTTTGENAVPSEDANNNGTPDYVEWTAQAADSSYRHEVQTLGYSDPIPDTNNPYQIYFENIGFYGYTEISNGSTYIVLHNNFNGFPENDDPHSNQRGSVRVTVAHELKHAIQYAATQWNGETDKWSEMDATLMEEVVYDEVNDYYHYLRDSESIFSNPESSFYPGSYYHVSWALFFEEKYGPQFWPSVWQIIRNNPQITMVDALSQQLGGKEAFRKAYIESQLWHYASGSNALNGFGFEERNHYPDPPAMSGNQYLSEDINIPKAGTSHKLNNFSGTYYAIIDRPSNGGGNVAIEAKLIDQNTGIGLLGHFTDGSSDSKTVTSSSKERAIINTDWSWDNIASVSLILTNSDTNSSSDATIVQVGSSNFDQLTLHQNYPNPFQRSTNIRFTLAEPSQIKLEIYDSIGRRVRTIYDDQELDAGLYVENFETGSLASGVYIYRLTTDQQVTTKKMTLIK